MGARSVAITAVGGFGLVCTVIALRRFLGDFYAAMICLGAMLAELQFSFVNRYATVLLSAFGLFGITFVLRLYAGDFWAAAICTGAVCIDCYLHGWKAPT